MITVLFIICVAETFIHFECLYNKMRKTTNFNPIIVLTNRKTKAKGERNTLEEMLIEKNIEFINYSKKPFDIKTLNPDYVFYNTPYNHVYPAPIRSTNVSTFAKVCYIPYGYNFIHVKNLECIFNTDFFDSCDYNFMENEVILNYFKNYVKNNKINNIAVGHPKVEYINSKQISKNNIFHAIWTPRWNVKEDICTYDKYINVLMEYFSATKNTKLSCRFHPMHNYGYENVVDYTKKYKNIEFDKNNDYSELFVNSHVLISDASTLITEYYSTGNPIIYLYNREGVLNPFGDILEDSLYIVKNKYDLIKILDSLKTGYDPKKIMRDELIKKYYSIYSPCKNIMKILEYDKK